MSKLNVLNNKKKSETPDDAMAYLRDLVKLNKQTQDTLTNQGSAIEKVLTSVKAHEGMLDNHDKRIAALEARCFKKTADPEPKPEPSRTVKVTDPEPTPEPSHKTVKTVNPDPEPKPAPVPTRAAKVADPEPTPEPSHKAVKTVNPEPKPLPTRSVKVSEPVGRPAEWYRYFDAKTRTWKAHPSLFAAKQAGGGFWEPVYVWEVVVDGVKSIDHFLDAEEIQKYIP